MGRSFYTGQEETRPLTSTHHKLNLEKIKTGREKKNKGERKGERKREIEKDRRIRKLNVF